MAGALWRREYIGEYIYYSAGHAHAFILWMHVYSKLCADLFSRRERGLCIISFVHA